MSRIKNNENIFYYGAQWFSITDDLARYIISKEKFIWKHFKDTSCCDELFLQTIVYNSDFYKNLYLYEDDNYGQIMRYIDWKRGEPYTFTKEDYDLLMNSNMFFARKFSTSTEERKQIVDEIYESIKINKKEKK